ncbi:DNA replication/repair protein RecF [Spiribacter vilamensis]|uniref:DNA replication and repair protein RecF n=1 Tax=Spiribacter vilamensis TaxID=531306 RepID=A0A4Q8D2I5_9GAMM|nr:DNA replication/repair protein RecF [Spiribacter vilamensis]RZU99520.1 DNA replication and repair protein RecF [Spiribacter vilamensis]TVO61509.1 DNA replication/repair protein RecF [Spiribacter vilamensis]
MEESADADGLVHFRWQSVRHLEAGSIDPHPRLNIFQGANAAGKTSLLEAVHFLARSRSFITHRTARLIRSGESEALVSGRIRAQGGIHRLGVQHGHGETRVRLDGRDVTILSESAWLLPLQVLNTEAQRLLTDGPVVRRAFLNWGVFHVEPTYRDDWRRYQRALRQRNAALKSGQRRLASAWEPDMVEAAESVDAHRRRFLAAVIPNALTIAGEWLPDLALDWRYRSGWRAGEAFGTVLAEARDQEITQGFSLHGPHRADWRIIANGVEATGFLSRGQQKLLVAAIKLALIEHWSAASTQRPVVLVDDLPAELDGGHRAELVHRLEIGGAQVFLTAIEGDLLPVIGAARWFHVEHGRITTTDG